MNLFLLCCVLFPNFFKRFVYRKLLGWSIGQNVKIGFSYIDAKDVVIGDRVRIGHGNVIRNLKSLRIGGDTYIANFNSIFGASYEGWASTLEIGQSVNFMSHHFLDVGGTITIGDRAIIGGRDTQIWAHGLAYDSHGNPDLQPLNVMIGRQVYIAARSTLVGCTIPDRTVVGAGSVVTKQFVAESCPYLIAGNPAIIKKRYQADSSELASVHD
jgi:acetyltransferase-like isoleucine patch superfamily enzyme